MHFAKDHSPIIRANILHDFGQSFSPLWPRAATLPEVEPQFSGAPDDMPGARFLPKAGAQIPVRPFPDAAPGGVAYLQLLLLYNNKSRSTSRGPHRCFLTRPMSFSTCRSAASRSSGERLVRTLNHRINKPGLVQHTQPAQWHSRKRPWLSPLHQ